MAFGYNGQNIFHFLNKHRACFREFHFAFGNGMHEVEFAELVAAGAEKFELIGVLGERDAGEIDL